MYVLIGCIITLLSNKKSVYCAYEIRSIILLHFHAIKVWVLQKYF